jgi:hypothetical protein
MDIVLVSIVERGLRRQEIDLINFVLILAHLDTMEYLELRGK